MSFAVYNAIVQRRGVYCYLGNSRNCHPKTQVCTPLMSSAGHWHEYGEICHLPIIPGSFRGYICFLELFKVEQLRYCKVFI